MKHIYFAILFFLTLHSQAQTLETDRLVLIDLYNSTGGANWTNKTGWTLPGTTGDNPCGWYGITCSGGRVKEINLYNNNLTGTIPTSIGNLSVLTFLSLSNNHLSGTIPAQIGNLTNLTGLYLYLNQLSGSIPIELTGLNQLKRLSISRNQLTGSIPVQIENLTHLEELDLNSNQFSGSIPVEIGNMTSLKWIYLFKNLLTGGIPSSFGNLINVSTLFLDENQLTGSIPTTLGNMSSLASFIAGHNQLSGSLPVELANLPLLRQLSLSYNQITGPIPSELGDLPTLENLYLDNNLLTGNIPTTLGNLSALESMNLGNNQLAGQIPAELGNISSLKQIFLNANNLTGSIPNQLGNLSNLKILWLQDNQLSGNIPSELGNLSMLTMLSLSDNLLTGNIPASLGTLSNLSSFFVSFNQLSGTIPDLSSIPVTANVQISYNNFNFSGIESNVSKLDIYSPQANIVISNANNVLSVDAGGTISNNTYRWYKDNFLVQTTTGNNSYAITGTGTYRVVVTNSLAGQLTLASDNYLYSPPLPVTLVNFNGTRSEDYNLLKWTTTLELNNTGFEIERSQDAKVFEKIGSVDGKGQSTSVQSYQFIDKNPLSRSYYRLKQIDYDGRYSYSRIIQVTQEDKLLKVYPNPVRDLLTVESASEDETVTIYNLAGKAMLTKPLMRKQTILASDFPPGVYVLTVGTQTTKFVIEN